MIYHICGVFQEDARAYVVAEFNSIQFPSTFQTVQPVSAKLNLQSMLHIIVYKQIIEETYR